MEIMVKMEIVTKMEIMTNTQIAAAMETFSTITESSNVPGEFVSQGGFKLRRLAPDRRRPEVGPAASCCFLFKYRVTNNTQMCEPATRGCSILLRLGDLPREMIICRRKRCYVSAF